MSGELDAQAADDLRERLQKALASGKLILLDPLPRRVRLRLWRARKIDRLGCWLVEHGHGRAAIALWRASGSWDGRR